MSTTSDDDIELPEFDPPPLSINEKGGQRHDWERFIQLIEKRKWDNVITNWRGVQFELPESLRIEHEIAELVPVHNAIKQIENEQVPVFFDDIESLREGLLLESYILLLKALNVAGGAHLHIDAGACGWSITSGYHSAFYAAKAIMGMWGVSLIELDKTYLLDVWAPPPKLSSKELKRLQIKPTERFMLAKWVRSRVDHQPVWQLFQRVIRVASADENIWPKDLISFLRTRAADSFASDRNLLHYSNHYWPFPEELKGYKKPIAFCGKICERPAKDFMEEAYESNDANEWSILLGHALCWLGCEMFDSISYGSHVLKQAMEILNVAKQDAFHPKIATYFSAQRGFAPSISASKGIGRN